LKKVKKVSGIYKIENTDTGKIYVGSSVNIHRRWNEHKRDLKKNEHGNKYLQNSWNKYGGGSFKFTVLETVSDTTKLIEREQYFIDTLKSHDKKIGFNIFKTAGSPLGRKHSQETKDKIGQSNRGKKYSEQALENFRNAQRLRRETYVISDETRKKLSLANTGRKHTEKAKKAISNSKIGSKNALSILDETQVREIKLLLKLSNLTLDDIANMYKVCFQDISNIKRKITWKHVIVNEDDRLDWQLAYAIKQINDSKMKPELSVREYLRIKECLENGYKNAEISRITGILNKRVSDVRNGVLSKKLLRDIELYQLNLEGKIVENTSIYEAI
jgi:group I intron endonuclease